MTDLLSLRSTRIFGFAIGLLAVSALTIGALSATASSAAAQTTATASTVDPRADQAITEDEVAALVRFMTLQSEGDGIAALAVLEDAGIGLGRLQLLLSEVAFVIGSEERNVQDELDAYYDERGVDESGRASARTAIMARADTLNALLTATQE